MELENTTTIGMYPQAMAGLSTAASYAFLNPEALRASQAQQLRGQEDAVANQLRASFGDGLAEPGTVITAKYQYRVGADGALYPIQTKITTEAAQQPESALDKQANQKRSNDSRRQSNTLADVTRPRPELSPTDELSLFSDINLVTRLSSIPPANNNVAATVVSSTVQGEAEDANGEKVDVEILPPQAQASTAQETGTEVASGNLASRAQQTVANLYARNADAPYSEIRSVQFAA